MRWDITSEDVLNSRTDDPRIIRMRVDCPRCHAPRGSYCRTDGGYSTLHQVRNPVGIRELDERLNHG